MITFLKIANSSDPLFTRTYELYRLAFPPEERRSFGALEYVLNHRAGFEADALMKEGNFCGFFTYWNFDKFYYVEHFAVDPAMRGQNIGSEVMKAFLEKINKPVVLEVEMPENADAIRRIRFYEKLGLKVVSHSYVQPYYDGSGKILPMLIMTDDYHFADKHFKLIKKTLHEEVYNYFQEEE